MWPLCASFKFVRLVALALLHGDFFCFPGRTWHPSSNTNVVCVLAPSVGLIRECLSALSFSQGQPCAHGMEFWLERKQNEFPNIVFDMFDRLPAT